MSKSTWTGGSGGDWEDPDNWSPAGVPGANSDVTIATGDAVASASIGTVNSITDSSGLSFESAGTNTVTTFLDNSGGLRVDRKGGAGGTILNIGGALTNSGSLRVGNATLSAPDTVTAASLDNTGSIVLHGSSANQALLDVAGSAGFGAAGVLSGTVGLAGDSAIEFKSGQITSLAASAQLHLNGNDAFIEDATKLGSNSALAGLASIGAGAIFGLHNKAAVSTTGSLLNDGHIRLDVVAGDGGSSLTLAGALTNSGSVSIGNTTLSASDEVTAASLDNTGRIYLIGSSADQALLDVTTGSAGFGTAEVLSGNVQLVGDSAVEFKSGQITSLAAGAQLNLKGDAAFIEDSAATGSNSALTGLADIEGSLSLGGAASVSTTGALVNNGSIGVGGSGGATLTVAGTLTNTGSLSLSGASVTAKSFVNSGLVTLGGFSATGALNVSGTLTNNGTISAGGTSTQAIDLNVGALTNNGSISITNNEAEELAGAVGGAGSFSLRAANLQFNSSVSAGQTITEGYLRGFGNALVLEQAQSFAATISGFGTGDTIDATNFLLSGTSYNFVENIAGTGGTLTLTDGGLTANILMTGDYSNKSFTLAPDSGTGTLVKFA